MAIILKDTSDDPNKIVVECNGLRMFNNCLDLFVVCKNDNNNEVGDNVTIQLTEPDKNYVNNMYVRDVYGFSLVKGDIKAGSVREFFLNFNDNTCYLVSSDAARKDLSNVTPNPPLDWIVQKDVVTANLDNAIKTNYGVGTVLTKSKLGIVTITGKITGPSAISVFIRPIDTNIAVNGHSYTIDTGNPVGFCSGIVSSRSELYRYAIIESKTIGGLFQVKGRNSQNQNTDIFNFNYTITGQAKT
jgi:hypothetical protein